MATEKPQAILFTQCLQNDFVKPLRRREALPNRLHIGQAESARLMGDSPGDSPVQHVMNWAYRRTPAELLLVHLRDWHESDDSRQTTHLGRFGTHCLAGSEGAAYAFAPPPDARLPAVEIPSLTLNDFQDTELAAVLRPYARTPLPVGLMGVWTEAKILFLAYELATRYPAWRLAVCPALTASSSRAQHFLAIDQLRRILGVTILDSVGDFLEFLGGREGQFPLPQPQAETPVISLAETVRLEAEDELLLRHLFRDCRRVEARPLGGGFSGNLILGVESLNLHGHRQVPHVVKLGPRTPIGQERTAFERIEEVLGNNAPRISDFADHGGRGAIKYRYASMTGAAPVTFQKSYQSGLPADEIKQVLHEVFGEQLGRLYAAAERESCNLLDYYEFRPRWAKAVRERMNELGAESAGEGLIRLPAGPAFYDPSEFYAGDLGKCDALRADSVYFSYVHGDLNGANIILDSRRNVWLIDFFHTHRGHVLRDLIKLENDLLYIFTPLADSTELTEAMRLSDCLLAVEDLRVPPEAECYLAENPALARAFSTLRELRGFYADLLRDDHDPLQWQIAALRYAVHTLSFDESSQLQKQWALYTAGRCAERVRLRLTGKKYDRAG